MKKIIIVSHNFPPESVGAASRVHEMAKLLKNFYDVNIVCPPPTYPFTKHIKAKYFIHKENFDGLKLFRIRTFQPSQQNPSFFQRFLYYMIFPILTFFFLINFLRNVSFVIISTPPSSLLIITLVIRFFKKKLILDVRDLWVDAAASLGYIKKNSILTKLVKTFEIYCWKKADLIISNSVFTCNIIRKNLMIEDASKVKYFPFNVDLKIFKKITSVKTEKQIVYIGNFGVAQNLQAFISSIPIVIEKIPDLQIQLYGGGDCESEIKKLAKDLNVDSYIKFNNPVPRVEIPLILSKSLLGIIPLANNEALRYAIPTKTFEYFACGLPVLGYGSSNELEEIIRESKAGIYVEGNDHIEIAKQIVKLITNKDELENYSINAREFVERNIDYSFFLELQ